ncbi:hypothetical protein GQ42DRAFT_161448 [Ramicandelaber brevisporus]|nr:hypothetical protein GQ42DRAFT_161448 [Ramicandelaber brevisporus]
MYQSQRTVSADTATWIDNNRNSNADGESAAAAATTKEQQYVPPPQQQQQQFIDPKPASAWRQLTIMLYRNFLLQIRSRGLLSAQILIAPIVFMLLLFAMNNAYKTQMTRSDPHPTAENLAGVPLCQGATSGDPCVTIMYTPAVPETEQIMKIFAAKNVQNHGGAKLDIAPAQVADQLGVTRHMDLFQLKKPQSQLGIVAVPSSEAIYNYTLRFPNTTAFGLEFTLPDALNRSSSAATDPNVEANRIAYKVWFSATLHANDTGDPFSSPDILSLMRGVDEALIDGHGTIWAATIDSFTSDQDVHPSHIGVKVKEWPLIPPDDVGDGLVTSGGPLFYFSVLMIVFITTLNQIVAEREQGLRHMLDIVGLRPFIYWLSYFIINLVIIVIIALVTIAFGHVYRFRVFTDANFAALLISMILFGMAMINLAFLISTFLRKTLTAIMVGIFFFVVGLLFMGYVYCSPRVAYIWWDPNTSQAWYYILVWLPFFNFGTLFMDISLLTAGRYDTLYNIYIPGPGFGWKDMYKPVDKYLLPGMGFETRLPKVPPPVTSWYWLMANIVVFAVLTWYCDKVIPDQLGQHLSPFFFLQPSFWGIGGPKEISDHQAAAQKKVHSAASNSTIVANGDREKMVDVASAVPKRVKHIKTISSPLNLSTTVEEDDDSASQTGVDASGGAPSHSRRPSHVTWRSNVNDSDNAPSVTGFGRLSIDSAARSVKSAQTAISSRLRDGASTRSASGSASGSSGGGSGASGGVSGGAGSRAASNRASQYDIQFQEWLASVGARESYISVPRSAISRAANRMSRIINISAPLDTYHNFDTIDVVPSASGSGSGSGIGESRSSFGAPFADTDAEDSDVAEERRIAADPALQPQPAVRIVNLRKVYRPHPMIRLWRSVKSRVGALFSRGEPDESGSAKSNNDGECEEDDKVAVNALSLVLQAGTTLALCGQNGAGKSTTMHLLTGTLPISFGDALIHGRSVRDSPSAVRRLLGFCPQHDILFESLTAEEHIWLYAGLKGLDNEMAISVGEERLQALRLFECRKMLVSQYSGGMRRRLSVLLSTLGNPPVVIMDEASAGVDPLNTRVLWEFITRFKKDTGAVIIYSTHSMMEADILGDRIAVMVRGALVGLGSSLKLKSKFGQGYRLSLVVPEQIDSLAVQRLVAQRAPEAILESSDFNTLVYLFPRNGNTAKLHSFIRYLEASTAPKRDQTRNDSIKGIAPAGSTGSIRRRKQQQQQQQQQQQLNQQQPQKYHMGGGQYIYESDEGDELLELPPPSQQRFNNANNSKRQSVDIRCSFVANANEISSDLAYRYDKRHAIFAWGISNTTMEEVFLRLIRQSGAETMPEKHESSS